MSNVTMIETRMIGRRRRSASDRLCARSAWRPLRCRMVERTNTPCSSAPVTHGEQQRRRAPGPNSAATGRIEVRSRCIPLEQPILHEKAGPGEQRARGEEGQEIGARAPRSRGRSPGRYRSFPPARQSPFPSPLAVRPVFRPAAAPVQRKTDCVPAVAACTPAAPLPRLAAKGGMKPDDCHAGRRRVDDPGRGLRRGAPPAARRQRDPVRTAARQPPPEPPAWLTDFLAADRAAAAACCSGSRSPPSSCSSSTRSRMRLIGREWPLAAPGRGRGGGGELAARRGAGARSCSARPTRSPRAGRYSEAAHLLLFRSIEDIDARRPDLVRPALTSRDIAALPRSPARPRRAFARIAMMVERSLFARAAARRRRLARLPRRL